MKEGSEGDVGSDDVLTSRDADSTVSNGGNKHHLLSPALGITALALPSPEGGPLGGTTLANALLGITLGSNGDGIHSTNGAKMGLMVHHRGKSNGDSNGGGQDGNRSKQFTCGICTRSFGYKHVLQNHERTHTGEKPFECKECHKRFTRDHHLKTHMRLHTGEKPYHCNHCDRQFVQVANLRRHLRVHTGERPYACTLCSSRFSDSNQLKAHILIHKGEKPFFCEKCSGRFRRRHHLVHHKCPMDAANAGKPRRGRRPKAYDPPPTLLPALLTAPVQPPPQQQQQQVTPSAVSVIQQPPAAHMHQHMQRRPPPPPSALHLHLNGGYHHPMQSGPLDMTMSGNGGGGQVSVIVQPPRPSLPVYPEGVLDLSNSRSDSEAEPIEEEVDEELGMDSEDEDDSETELLLKHHQGVIACSWFDGLRKRVTSGKGMAAKGKTAI